MENELATIDYSTKIAALKNNAQMQAWGAQYREYEASGLSISAYLILKTNSKIYLWKIGKHNGRNG